MFKIVLSSVIVFFSLNASAQGVTFDNGKIQNFTIPHTDPTDVHLYLTNKSGTATRVAYKKIGVDFPAKWIVQFCDDFNCRATFVDDTFQTVANNGKVNLKITVYPEGFADTAVIKYEIYGINNPTKRDTVIATVMVQYGASVTTISTLDFQLYPNPAANQLNVFTNSLGKISVINAQGAVVKNISGVAGKNAMDIADLAKGVYVIEVAGSQNTLRKQFVKI